MSFWESNRTVSSFLCPPPSSWCCYILLFLFLFSLVCLFVFFSHSVILLRSPSLGPSTDFPTVISFHSVLGQIYFLFGLIWFFFDWAFPYYLHWLWICYPLSSAFLVAEITVYTTTTGHCCYMVILHFFFQFWESIQGFVLGKCAMSPIIPFVVDDVVLLFYFISFSTFFSLRFVLYIYMSTL